MMPFIQRVLLVLFSFWLFAVPAHAHLGHLGELAGHSHWIGVGAVVVAGVLAAVVGKLGDKPAEENDVDTDGADDTLEGELA